MNQEAVSSAKGKSKVSTCTPVSFLSFPDRLRSR